MGQWNERAIGARGWKGKRRRDSQAAEREFFSSAAYAAVVPFQVQPLGASRVPRLKRVYNNYPFDFFPPSFLLRRFFMCPKFDAESLVLSDAQEEDCGKTSRAAHARKKLDRKD